MKMSEARARAILGEYKIYPGTKRALIINVLKKRPGSEKDTPVLKQFLELVGCYVTVVQDTKLTKSGIPKAIKEFKASLDNVTCILVSVMSHGKKSVLFHTTNGKLNFTKDVLSQFNNKNCPQMRHKPKIFLANFCRGHSRKSKVDKDCDSSEDSDEDPEDVSVTEKDLVADETQADGYGTNSDQYVCFATYDDFPALRNIEEGCWFIQSFCEIGNRYADGKLDFKDIMALVFKDINEVRSSPDCRQCPTIQDTGFVKKLYLRQTGKLDLPKRKVRSSDVPDSEAFSLQNPVKNRKPTEVKVHVVAQLLADQAVITDNPGLFVAMLKGVKLSAFTSHIRLSTMGVKTWGETLAIILQAWKSSNAEDATIPNLIAIFTADEYKDFKAVLEKQAWKDAAVVYG